MSRTDALPSFYSMILNTTVWRIDLSTLGAFCRPESAKTHRLFRGGVNVSIRSHRAVLSRHGIGEFKPIPTRKTIRGRSPIAISPESPQVGSDTKVKTRRPTLVNAVVDGRVPFAPQPRLSFPVLRQ